jgi:hypothetical protein
MDQNWALLPDFGFLSTVGPSLVVKGTSNYPYFPQLLGKMSSARKANRLLRELKQKMADRICSDRYSLQNEIIPFILTSVADVLRRNEVSGAI